jgi:hypothetical protein
MARRDEWNILRAQECIKIRGTASSNEENGIDASFQESAHLSHLAIQLIVRAREQQLEAVFLNRLLEAVDEFREEWIVEGRYHASHRLALTRSERARRTVGYVARIRQQLLGSVSQRGSHEVGMIQDTRQGSGGYAAACSDGLQGFCRAPPM